MYAPTATGMTTARFRGDEKDHEEQPQGGDHFREPLVGAAPNFG